MDSTCLTCCQCFVLFKNTLNNNTIQYISPLSIEIMDSIAYHSVQMKPKFLCHFVKFVARFCTVEMRVVHRDSYCRPVPFPQSKVQHFTGCLQCGNMDAFRKETYHMSMNWKFADNDVTNAECSTSAVLINNLLFITHGFMAR